MSRYYSEYDRHFSARSVARSASVISSSLRVKAAERVYNYFQISSTAALLCLPAVARPDEWKLRFEYVARDGGYWSSTVHRLEHLGCMEGVDGLGLCCMLETVIVDAGVGEWR